MIERIGLVRVFSNVMRLVDLGQTPTPHSIALFWVKSSGFVEEYYVCCGRESGGR